RIVPYTASQVSGAGSTVDAAFPATALANVQPKVVTRTPVGSGNRILVIDIDFGTNTTIDALAALHTNLWPGGIWQAFGATAAQGPLGTIFSEPIARRLFGQSGWVAFGTAPTTRENRSAALLLGGPHSIRYLRVYFSTDQASFAEVGTLLPLQRLTMGQGPYENFELGSGRRVEDRSQVRALPGGETAIERGGRVPVWRAAWSNLTEAQYRELWDLLMEVGTGAPILAAEFQDGSTGQAEALHYGLIQSIDFSERVQLDKQRIELRVQELV
ncbi:MAG: hypothetical protein MUE77_10085, partial [Sandarakinorhabdus sp.]|nr:hypothetical protein [Sandarakinorhabdus sp.]